MPEVANILGVHVTCISQVALVETLAMACRSGEQCVAFYVNANGLRLSQSDPDFLNTLNRSDLTFCDGYGVALVARILGRQVPPRMTPPDWIDELFGRAGGRNHRLYLLGDEQAVVEACAARMRKNHPQIEIVGARSGFFDTSNSENTEVVSDIRRSRADILLVGMGSPRQEKWVDVNRDQLGATTIVTVGAMFRYYAGLEWRAPRWMSDHGLEWMGRLLRHPIQHFDRYVAGLPVLLVQALRARASDKGASSPFHD